MPDWTDQRAPDRTKRQGRKKATGPLKGPGPLGKRIEAPEKNTQGGRTRIWSDPASPKVVFMPQSSVSVPTTHAHLCVHPSCCFCFLFFPLPLSSLLFSLLCWVAVTRLATPGQVPGYRHNHATPRHAIHHRTFFFSLILCFFLRVSFFSWSLFACVCVCNGRLDSDSIAICTAARWLGTRRHTRPHPKKPRTT